MDVFRPAPRDCGPPSFGVWLVFGVSLLILLSATATIVSILLAPVDVYVHDTDFISGAGLMGPLCGFVAGVALTLIAFCWIVGRLGTELATSSSPPAGRNMMSSGVGIGLGLMILLLVADLLVLSYALATPRMASPYFFIAHTIGPITLSDEELRYAIVVVAGLLGLVLSAALLGLGWSLVTLRSHFRSRREQN